MLLDEIALPGLLKLDNDLAISDLLASANLVVLARNAVHISWADGGSKQVIYDLVVAGISTHTKSAVERQPTSMDLLFYNNTVLGGGKEEIGRAHV